MDMGKIYGGFRAEPIKKGAPKSNLKKHCEATKEYAENQQAMQIKAYGYSYVEPENVQYNRVLVDCGDKSYDEIIQSCNREKFGGKTIRRDGVPMIDTVFYYSPEKTKNLLCYLHRKNTRWKKEHAEWWEDYQALPKEERREKVNEEYNWVQSWAAASEKWAEENLGQVVHCVLHCHEGTPHVDCKTLAIKEKEGGKWIWAKREILGNPAHLSKMQSKYAKECGEKFGLERGEIKEAGELRKHAETERHMAAEARKQEESYIKELDGIIDANTRHISMQDNQIDGKQATLADLDAQIATKQEQMDKIAETVYKPYVEAVERLVSTFEKLTPKQRKIEHESVSDLLKSSNIVFGKGKPMGISKATTAMNEKSDSLESTYLSIDDDDDYER